jgi:hypothetical protein
MRRLSIITSAQTEWLNVKRETQANTKEDEVK